MFLWNSFWSFFIFFLTKIEIAPPESISVYEKFCESPYLRRWQLQVSGAKHLCEGFLLFVLTVEE